MTEYNPDSWVVLKMTHKEQIIYKVLGGWAESYTNGSSWRLNSGIERAEYDISNDVWKFYGSSGSVYNCHPDAYGLRVATYPVYQQMIDKYPTQVEMLENQDWSNFKFGDN